MTPDSPTLEKPVARARPAPRQLADLPGPRGIPLLGNLLQLDPPRMHQQLEQWCKDFGPFFKLKLGRRYTLIVGDHQAVASMLRDRPDGFKRTTRLEQIGAEMGLKPGVFAANDDEWRRQRRMVMAGFDPAHVKGYFPSLQGVADRLVRRWQKAARDGRDIDLQADLMRYTVDTIAGLAFGAEVNTLESDGDVIQQHLDKIFPALLKRMLSPLPTWRWFPTRTDRELARGMAAVNEAVDGFVAQARRRIEADPALRTQPRNLLEAMIAAADEPGSGITDVQVSGNVMTMLLAGEDTTANTIAWLIDLLWRHPDALARATEEVRRVIGDSKQPSFEQVSQLDFVEACAHETMRLRPVAPILGLQAKKDVVVGGVQVPKGTVVVNLMRRDGVNENHVPRAAAFEPQRWLADGGPGAVAGNARRTSMPFGAGPRICPGRYLALAEMKMLVAMLLWHFEIDGVTTPDGADARERIALTMSAVGLKLRLRLRQPEHERAREHVA